MEGELIVEGKQYISSKRFGKEVGYTNDYLSKLCRSGIVEGKLVGRTWFVLPESFRAFQQELEQKRVKKKEIIETEEQKIIPKMEESIKTTKEEIISDISDIDPENKNNREKKISFEIKNASLDLKEEIIQEEKKVHSRIPIEIFIGAFIGFVIFIISVVGERSFIIDTASKNHPAGIYNSKIELSPIHPFE